MTNTRFINPRYIKFMVMTVVLVFCAGLAPQVMAFAGPKGPGGPGFPMRALMQLDLSDTQKADLKKIIDEYQPQLHEYREKLRSMRKEYQNAALPEEFNEDKVRAVFGEMAPVMEDMFVLGTKMRTDIRAVLTADQISQLQEKRDRWENRTKKRQKCKKAMMETLLETESE